MPPKLLRSCSSFFTSITWGKPAMPWTNGYSIGSPIARANAMNCAGVSAWSRKNTTWCSRKTLRIARAGISFDRSTPRISAPSAPAMRRTFTPYFSTLLDLDVGVLDDRAVAPLFVLHEGGHLVGRVGRGVHAQAEVALPELRRLHRFCDFRCQFRGHLARRARRRRIADPCSNVVAGDVRRFGKRRHVGQPGSTFSTGHAEHLEPAGLDVSGERGDRLEGVADLPADEVRDRGRAALVRDMAGLEPCHRVEELGHEMRGGAGA